MQQITTLGIFFLIFVFCINTVYTLYNSSPYDNIFPLIIWVIAMIYTGIKIHTLTAKIISKSQ